MEASSRVIQECRYGFRAEPLIKTFGFKGGSLSELWQVVCHITLRDGTCGTGVGVQSVLWSDAGVFGSHTQKAGNELMLRTTAYALQMLKGRPFTNPRSLQEAILDGVREYAVSITGKADLSETFVLNALVAVDFALWQIEAKLQGEESMEALLSRSCPTLKGRETVLGAIPLISYNCGEEEIKALLDSGFFFLKIKIGSDPAGDGDGNKMVRWDTERVCVIHRLAKDYNTPYTHCGHPVYYLDANGRYTSKPQLERLLSNIRACGALERVALLEEPFDERNLQPVRDLPVRVAGDESAHSVADVRKLVREYGYGAIALKPVAKTLSTTLAMISAAYEAGAYCFCADLTVPPVMLDWNMRVAARLRPLPELHCGVVESNGAQNYRNWERFYDMLPPGNWPWLRSSGGIFHLGDAFYQDAVGLNPLQAYDAIASRLVLTEGKQFGE